MHLTTVGDDEQAEPTRVRQPPTTPPSLYDDVSVSVSPTSRLTLLLYGVVGPY